MNFASQETATDYEGIVHQLQLMAQFLEELSQKVEAKRKGNSVTLLHRNTVSQRKITNKGLNAKKPLQAKWGRISIFSLQLPRNGQNTRP